MRRLRLWASVLTVGGAAFVAVGACSVPDQGPTPPPPPAVLGERYVLLSITSNLPSLTEDSIGQPVRVYTDTLYFAPDSTYVEAGRIGRFLGFPSENITTFRSAPRRYQKINDNEIRLPVILGGRGHLFLYGSDNFGLQVRKNGTSDNSVPTYWGYMRR